MPPVENALGQLVGDPLPDWQPPSRPSPTEMTGRLCRLEPLDAAKHAALLHEAHSEDREGRNWTYLPYGPFETAADYRSLVEAVVRSDDTLFHAIVGLATGRPIGVASYLRMDPPMGSIEVGHVSYSPALQRTAAATEAMYLMMRRVFDELGYRRYEWKCDSLNGPSRAAAERLGFTYEGTFRSHYIFKGRNRDTSWYAITDSEWPAIKRALERWLAPSNFDDGGRQRSSLAAPRRQSG